MQTLRHVYAEKGLSQIPRLLSLQDRNPFSPTYGCFKRTYWLDKVDDFPDALPQFGVLSLALAYHYDMPGNVYKDQPKIREWILAGMRYWTKIQHNDGSFDEFYPNEHGWTGPTGFLLYAMARSYMILQERNEFPEDFRNTFFEACRKAARYIIAWDEHGTLANHHAMAVLPVYYTYHILREQEFLQGYEKKLQEFLTFHSREGWSLEYDGADIGYLSATVSFLAKVYKLHRDERLKKVMEESVEFLSYFVYPNGFYAGTMGSRNTLHFYSHGCEILAPESPLAGRVADELLQSLNCGKIVPAEIQADRYFLYRIPEHLESYIDYGQRGESTQLPYERPDFRKVFPLGRFYIEKQGQIYLVANAAKGGVTKIFDVPSGRLVASDCGMIGRTDRGAVLTSQWIDPSYNFLAKEHGYSVAGALHRVPSHKLFTPLKNIIFRLYLLLFCWHTGMAYRTKGLIRRLLMLKSEKGSVFFYRDVEIHTQAVVISDTIKLTKGVRLSSLQIGDEFAVRYVPQSRYFQSQEFDTRPYLLSEDQLKSLNHSGKVRLRHTYPVTGPDTVEILPNITGSMGVEYSEGRKMKRALTYRLRRRADEVIRSIRTHSPSPAQLLDLGSAEGKLLSLIQDAFPHMHCTGVECSPELIDACVDDRFKLIEGNVMQLEFPDHSFDVVAATAIIEHVDDPAAFVRQIARLLRPGGIVVITTPDPFFEHIATAIGHIADEEHQETMNVTKLSAYCRQAGLEPVRAEKFMCSPWGFPFELGIEKWMKRCGLGSLLLNQIVVGRKP